MSLPLSEKFALKKQKKLERKRKAEERKKELLRNCLQREIKYGALTIKKHEHEWRLLTENIALNEKKDELNFMWVHFERIIDFKDYIISMLMDELDNCNEHHLLSLKNHCKKINNLIQVYYNSMKELNTENTEAIAHFHLNYEKQGDSANKLTEIAETSFKTTLHKQEINKTKQNKIFMTRLFCEIDDEKDRHTFEKRHLVANLDNKMEIIWKNTEAMFKNLKTSIFRDMELYDKVKELDEQNATMIDNAYKKYQQLVKRIKYLKAEYREMTIHDQEVLNSIKMEAKFFDNCMFRLKNKLLYERNHDQRKRVLLTVEWNRIMEYLKYYEKRATLLFYLMKINRKYETLHEKVLPFHINMFLNVSSKQHHKLTFFHQKLGMVKSSRASLLEEKIVLINNIKKLEEQLDYIRYYGEIPNSIIKEQEDSRSLKSIFCIASSMQTNRNNLKVSQQNGYSDEYNMESRRRSTLNRKSESKKESLQELRESSRILPGIQF